MRPFGLFEIAESFSEPSKDEPVSRWLLGAAFPLATVAYAAMCALRERAPFVQMRPFRFVELHGSQAVAAAALFAAAGLFAHAHWFWANHPRFAGIAEIGKLVALGGIAAACLWLFYLVLIVG